MSFTLFACAGAPEAPPGVEASPINLGQVSPAADNAVVAVTTVRPPPFDYDLCTGTLVAPNVMLTSLECVTLFQSRQSVTCDADGSLDPSSSGGMIGAPVDPGDVRVFYGASIGDEPPSAYGKQIFVTDTPEVCEDDLAAVVLDRALPTQGYALRLSRDVALGDEVTAIGWAETGYDTRFKRDVTVIAVGPDQSGDEPGPAPPRSFLVGPGLCWGDRGGPALSTDTGFVAGIYARPLAGGLICRPEGAEDDDGIHRFVKIAPYEGMIRQAFDAAGATLATDLPNDGSHSHESSGCAVNGKGAADSAWLVAGVLALAWGTQLRRRAAST